MNDDDRRQWVDNDEGLYQWWRRSGVSMSQFVRRNRDELDQVIAATLGGDRPQQSPYDSIKERGQ